jgi:hypothetical protein
MAKAEMINPIKVFETPNDLAKIGMAGIMSPKPTATRKDIEVNTATSLGRSLKGELNLILNQAFLAMRKLAIESEDYYYRAGEGSYCRKPNQNLRQGQSKSS